MSSIFYYKIVATKTFSLCKRHGDCVPNLLLCPDDLGWNRRPVRELSRKWGIFLMCDGARSKKVKICIENILKNIPQWREGAKGIGLCISTQSVLYNISKITKHR